MTKIRVFLQVLARLQPPEGITLALAMQLRRAFGNRAYAEAAMLAAADLGGAAVAEAIAREEGQKMGATARAIDEAVDYIKKQ